MTRASSLHALVAVCVLAGCSKSGPETGAAPAAAPAKDSTQAVDKMMKDTTGMMKDTTMHMPADSAKK